MTLAEYENVKYVPCMHSCTVMHTPILALTQLNETHFYFITFVNEDTNAQAI